MNERIQKAIREADEAAHSEYCTCSEPRAHSQRARAAIRIVVTETQLQMKKELQEIIEREASKHPGCCHHLRDAILADKEPTDGR